MGLLPLTFSNILSVIRWHGRRCHIILGNLPGNGYQVPYLMSVLVKDDGSDL